MTVPRSPTQPGDTLTFGNYPQTAAGRDRTPIEWLVLEHSRGKLLLLSRHILDCRRYHDEFAATSWRECALRQWLNGEFYDRAFTAAEQQHIQLACNSGNGVNSPDTRDRVFLLSEDEVLRVTESLGKDFRRACGTEFAKQRKPDGCRLYVMDKNIPSDYLTMRGKRQGCSWWWLRTRGQLKDHGPDPARVTFVGTRASIRHYARVDQTGDGVRPAIWVRRLAK